MYTLMLWTIIAINTNTGEITHGWLYVDEYEEIIHEGARYKSKALCEASAKVKKIPSGFWKCFEDV